jgi:hypothetical protein
LYPGGRPPVTKAKDVPIAAPEPEEPVKEVLLTPRQKLEQEIARDPKNIAGYLELAEILIESNQLNAVEALLSRAISACGDQGALVKKLNHVRVLRAEQQQVLQEVVVQRDIDESPRRVPWLELVLGPATLLLVLQLVPSAGASILKIVDFRGWSRLTWLLFNASILTSLTIIRFLPKWPISTRRPRRGTRISSGNS